MEVACFVSETPFHKLFPVTLFTLSGIATILYGLVPICFVCTNMDKKHFVDEIKIFGVSVNEFFLSCFSFISCYSVEVVVYDGTWIKWSRKRSDGGTPVAKGRRRGE